MDWGSCGARNEWGENGVKSGIVRTVDKGVFYSAPPEGVGQPAWLNVESEAYCYFMPWPDDRGIPPRYETLRDLAERLRGEKQQENSAGRTPDYGNSDLARLDVLFDDLLTAMARLHGAGRGLGLIHPDNILLVERADAATYIPAGTAESDRLEFGNVLAAAEGDTPRPSRSWQLVLPDLGFVWDRNAPARQPSWLSQPNWDFLWDEPLDTLNDWLFTGDHQIVGHDLRSVARLMAWTLVGDAIQSWPHDENQAFRVVPSIREHPETAGTVWGIIDRILRGQLGDVSQVQRELRQMTAVQYGEREIPYNAPTEASPLQAYFLTPPPLPPPGPVARLAKVAKRLAKATLVTAVVLAVVSAAGWYFIWRPEQQRHAGFDRVASAAKMSIEAVSDLASADKGAAAVRAACDYPPPSGWWFFAARNSNEEKQKEDLKGELMTKYDRLAHQPIEPDPSALAKRLDLIEGLASVSQEAGIAVDELWRHARKDLGEQAASSETTLIDELRVMPLSPEVARRKLKPYLELSKRMTPQEIPTWSSLQKLAESYGYLPESR